MKNSTSKAPSETTFNATSHDAQGWSEWFWNIFFPNWVVSVQDGEQGVFDALDVNGKPNISSNKSVLTQARTLFTLSHAALLSDDPALVSAARKQAKFLERFQKSKGLYRCIATCDGKPTGQEGDEAARSYDHSFIILGLITWNRVSPSDETIILVEECWEALQSQLRDPETGLLLNDDINSNMTFAQNPHMHLYEACLQAYRMNDDVIWLKRAAELRSLGLEHFMDQDSGSIAEFLTPNLKPLSGVDGLRREIGHQCEWAWLLEEEAELTGNQSLCASAARLMDFANCFGFAADDASLKGAAVDAVLISGEVLENSFLLWPQTEAIKILAIQHKAGHPTAGNRARELLCLMFDCWFKGRPTFVNQLDADGNSIWSEALTRLMYHIVLAMTEGARAGLWTDIPSHDSK